MRSRGLLLLVALCVAGCGQRPSLDVSASVVDGQVVFDIPYKDVNGLLGFRVEDENGKVLWHVRLPCEACRRITYGKLPFVHQMAAHQEIPADGSAPPDIRGQRLRVKVEYQFDDSFAACAGGFEKTVQVP